MAVCTCTVSQSIGQFDSKSVVEQIEREQIGDFFWLTKCHKDDIYRNLDNTYVHKSHELFKNSLPVSKPIDNIDCLLHH